MKDLLVGGDVVKREIDRKAAQVYFADIDDARYDEVMNEIDHGADDAQRAESEQEG